MYFLLAMATAADSGLQQCVFPINYAVSLRDHEEALEASPLIVAMAPAVGLEPTTH